MFVPHYLVSGDHIACTVFKVDTYVVIPNIVFGDYAIKRVVKVQSYPRARESKTEGHWKPSPGSIYPLLSWLQDKGYTKETSDQEPGLKRYTLTDEGKAFLEEHVKRKKEIRERFDAFRPPFHRFPWLNSYPEKAKELFKSGKGFMKTSWNLLDNLREKYSEEAAAQAKEVFEQATEKLNEIAKKMEQTE